MPFFDIVSKFDRHELANAVDQANREIKSRFDLRDTNARITQVDNVITLLAPTTFQLQQLVQLLEPKLVKRGIKLDNLTKELAQENLHEAKQRLVLNYGISHEVGKSISKLIKKNSSKVQSSIMGERIRVTSKKRDDLQEVIVLLKATEFGVPLQFENFHD